MADRHQTVSFEKQKLQKLAVVVPLVATFVYLSYTMLCGPCTMNLPGFKVTGDLDFRLTTHSGEPLLSGRFDFNHPRPDSMSFGKTLIERMDYCQTEQEYNMGCIEEEHHQRIRVAMETAPAAQCYRIVREGLRCPSQEVKDCFDMSDAHWYGGFQSLSQPWPLEKAQVSQAAYVSGDNGMHQGHTVGGVLERLFFSSKGVGIFVDHDVPLHVSLNPLGDRRLCLSASHDGGYYRSDSPPVLNYTICHAASARAIFDYMSARFLPRPTDIPDVRLFTHPVWSTWAIFNKDVTQQKVLDFAANISHYGLPASQLEVDDDWTPAYGDLEFNRVKFPDPGLMVKQLNDMGYRVTLWTHPFLSLTSKAFEEAAKNDYAVTTRGSRNPALVRWWNEEMAGLLDVTNPAAVLWYLQRLEALRTAYNISSFKFDAGEALFVPQSQETYGGMRNPGEYSRGWAELAYQADPETRHQEVRAAWNSQHLPIFLRIFDRWTTWEAESGGLQTLIPATLTFGLLGYPFVLPDMIGGNAYSDTGFAQGTFPDKEMFVRWLEASALLPALQFSVAPWMYDDEVVAITKKFVALHEEYAPLIVDLARQAVTSGRPIVRPLWWTDPLDEVALTSSQQFLLGDDVMVAPVTERGARKRDVYVIAGDWTDVLRGGVVSGPVWLREYEVQLDELPIFQRVVV